MRSLVLLALAVLVICPVLSSYRAGRVRLRGGVVLTSAALACMALGVQPLLP